MNNVRHGDRNKLLFHITELWNHSSTPPRLHKAMLWLSRPGMLRLSLTNGNVIGEGKICLSTISILFFLWEPWPPNTIQTALLEKRIASNLSAEDKYFHVNPRRIHPPAKSPEQNLLHSDFLFYSDTCSVRRKVPLARAVLFSCFTLGQMQMSFEGRLCSSTTLRKPWKTPPKEHGSTTSSSIDLIKNKGQLLSAAKQARISPPQTAVGWNHTCFWSRGSFQSLPSISPFRSLILMTVYDSRVFKKDGVWMVVGENKQLLKTHSRVHPVC